MRLSAVVIFACACGGGTHSTPVAQPQQPTQQPQVAQQPKELTPEEFCKRLESFTRCDWAKQINMDHAACVHDFTSDPKGKDLISQVGGCFEPGFGCDEAMKCIASKAPAGEEGGEEGGVEGGQEGGLDELRECNDKTKMGAVGYPRADYDKRNGAGVKKFSQAVSSKDKPIEVCGIPAENDWLVATACDNGSHPFTDRGQAEGSRAGNLGAGGRCGSIIDLYKVKCPEKTYDVYLDGYVCPLPDHPAPPAGVQKK